MSPSDVISLNYSETSQSRIAFFYVVIVTLSEVFVNITVDNVMSKLPVSWQCFCFVAVVMTTAPQYTVNAVLKRKVRLTIELGIGGVLEEGPRAEVDEFDLSGPQVHQQVLVLDVSVDDATGVAVSHGLQHLQEEAARRRLVQRAALRDVIKQVLPRLWTLHHHQPAVRTLPPVQQPHHATKRSAHLLQQHDLQRNRRAAALRGHLQTHHQRTVQKIKTGNYVFTKK